MGVAGATSIAPLHIVQRIKFCTLGGCEALEGRGGGTHGVPALRAPAVAQVCKQAEPRSELGLAHLANAIGQAEDSLRCLSTVLRAHMGAQSSRRGKCRRALGALVRCNRRVARRNGARP